MRYATRERAPTLAERSAGVLLHPLSLPGPPGAGDTGACATVFVDYLARAGLRWWQVLPIGPEGPGDSPYSSPSAFALSRLLASPPSLALDGTALRRGRAGARGRIDYGAAHADRTRFLSAEFEALRRSPRGYAALDEFRQRERGWLDDYACYVVAKSSQGGRPWWRWSAPLRERDDRALARFRAERADEIELVRFEQFVVDAQWRALRRRCTDRGVGLLGDVPIFVAADSADVWAARELFRLDRSGRPAVVTGVPPDYFSRTGQLWGHPHYRWREHRRTRFAWWTARFRRAFELFDAVRIDHFIGFHRLWAVPGRARTARRGAWVSTPGRELLATVRSALGALPIVAEDLGLLTPEAADLRDEFGFPGMRVLQFAFGEGAGSRMHLPHRHPPRCVVYTGTHDNDTVVGWHRSIRAARSRRGRDGLSEHERFERYAPDAGQDVHWRMMRMAFSSPANLAIIPLQDILGLPGAARMNFPGRASGNWTWRYRPGVLTDALARRLRRLAEAYERC